MYARVMPRPPFSRDRHVVHVQVESIGVKSRANTAFLILIVPEDVMALPNRWSCQESCRSFEGET
jgi:hypothetical protein